MKQLSKNEMKKIFGGYVDPGGGGGSNICCAHAVDNMSQSNQVWCCGLSKSAAQAQANTWASTQGYSDIHWCCDSCTQTSSQNCS